MSTSISYEQGNLDDTYGAYMLFEETLADLIKRLGFAGATSWGDAEKLEKMWQQRRPLVVHMTRTKEQFWLAKQEGELVGYARTLMRDGTRELTDFFVKPGVQSGGVGRNLIERAFPKEAAKYRFIIATADFRAQALYLKSGVFPRFPIYYFGREPEQVALTSDLTFAPLENNAATLALLGKLDAAVIGFRRDVDQQWFLENRQGFCYMRNGRPVGYGYVGQSSGPFALLEATDFPAVLAHAESTVAAAGFSHFGVEVPTVNETAVNYLLSRKFKIDSFMAMFMSDRPFGNFDRYIITSPPFFV